MDDKLISDTRIYTNLQGLDKLKYASKNHSPEARKEVAEQFQAILLQMVMKSMRDANKAFGENDIFGNQQMELYQDMFDKQITLMMSNTKLGFSQMVEKNMAQMEKPTEQTEPLDKPAPVMAAQPLPKLPSASETSEAEGLFESPQAFVKTLWKGAKIAAHLLGANPEVLLAQAALETNWGKKVIPQNNQSSTHNLFNIKADSAWDRSSVAVDSLEQKNGVLVKEKSNFRSYGSFMESFMDYVDFLKTNGRYENALTKTKDPAQYLYALQEAGYATDQNYAEKIIKILSSPTFQESVEKMKITA